ncbi:unnamed protein product [Cuscuta europaea]|uniref:Uncharacterized protein n=1 Tax=Cuscuta europaea TaxID=41803 RepID=A0A9P0YIG7_CUSEU|nr:unnamed protein product [Cuscuta europaea]
MSANAPSRLAWTFSFRKGRACLDSYKFKIFFLSFKSSQLFWVPTSPKILCIRLIVSHRRFNTAHYLIRPSQMKQLEVPCALQINQQNKGGVEVGFQLQVSILDSYTTSLPSRT